MTAQGPEPHPTRPARLPVRAWRAVAGFFAKRWDRIRPSPRVRRAGALATLGLATALGAFVGTHLHTGLGWWGDLALGAGVVLLAVALVPLVLLLLRGVGRMAGHLIGKIGVAALLVLIALLEFIALPADTAVVMSLAAAVPLVMWVGALASITRGGFGQRHWFAKTFVVSALVVGLTGNGAFLWWLTDDGSDSHLEHPPRSAASDASAPPSFTGASPAVPGPFAVDVLTYGSGKDRHRAEFGAAVDLETSPVNGRPFVDMPDGWEGDLREHYWGFDAGALPRNGTVWYPRGDGPFPLILCVHGNHRMFEASDPGYEYLGELFASRGYVFVSVDENFLNSGGVAHGGMRKENDARAWMLLEHLTLWRQWNRESGHRFEGLVDLDRIGLIGHSRGGEAVGLAALFNRLSRYPDDASVTFDYQFGIRGVIAIAPVDGQYRPADHDTVVRDVSFFTLHGGHDADVTQFHGDRYYRRVTFTERGSSCFKASLWIHRANHGQFNTVWGVFDSGPPRAWFLNDRALMSGEEQRQIAEVFIGAFLEATLLDRDEYRTLFRDVRTAREFVPDDAILITRYEDPSFRVLTDFEEDADVTTTTATGGTITANGFAIWREGDIPLRRDGKRRDHGVELAWDRTAGDSDKAPTYEIQLAAPGDPNSGPAATDVLMLALAASDTTPEAPDYSDPEDEDEAADEDDTEDDDGGADEPDDEELKVATPIELSIELEDAMGSIARLPLHQFGTLWPPLDAVVLRDDFRPSAWRATTEPVLQTFRCHLAAFAREGIDPTQLTHVRLVFDVTESGAVFVDRIGFAR